MKRIIFILCALVLIVASTSCTETQRVRALGGTSTVNVEPGKRIMSATWNGENLFYLVEDMPRDYTPQDKELIESSEYGIIESKIIFHESR